MFSVLTKAKAKETLLVGLSERLTRRHLNRKILQSLGLGRRQRGTAGAAHEGLCFAYALGRQGGVHGFNASRSIAKAVTRKLLSFVHGGVDNNIKFILTDLSVRSKLSLDTVDQVHSISRGHTLLSQRGGGEQVFDSLSVLVRLTVDNTRNNFSQGFLSLDISTVQANSQTAVFNVRENLCAFDFSNSSLLLGQAVHTSDLGSFAHSPSTTNVVMSTRGDTSTSAEGGTQASDTAAQSSAKHAAHCSVHSHVRVDASHVQFGRPASKYFASLSGNGGSIAFSQSGSNAVDSTEGGDAAHRGRTRSTCGQDSTSSKSSGESTYQEVHGVRIISNIYLDGVAETSGPVEPAIMIVFFKHKFTGVLSGLLLGQDSSLNHIGIGVRRFSQHFVGYPRAGQNLPVNLGKVFPSRSLPRFVRNENAGHCFIDEIRTNRSGQLLHLNSNLLRLNAFPAVKQGRQVSDNVSLSLLVNKHTSGRARQSSLVGSFVVKHIPSGGIKPIKILFIENKIFFRPLNQSLQSLGVLHSGLKLGLRDLTHSGESLSHLFIVGISSSHGVLRPSTTSHSSSGRILIAVDISQTSSALSKVKPATALSRTVDRRLIFAGTFANDGRPKAQSSRQVDSFSVQVLRGVGNTGHRPGNLFSEQRSKELEVNILPSISQKGAYIGRNISSEHTGVSRVRIRTSDHRGLGQRSRRELLRVPHLQSKEVNLISVESIALSIRHSNFLSSEIKLRGTKLSRLKSKTIHLFLGHKVISRHLFPFSWGSSRKPY